MSLEYHKLKPKRFAKKSYKHSLESRYWKKFQSIPLEKQEEGLQRSDIHFCEKDKPYLMATAVSARVDLYKLTQPASEEAAKEESIKPSNSIFKFKDTVTSVRLRQDGNLILCGEKSGRIQLVELQNKFILKTYTEYQNQLNSFDFKQSMREFVASANETSIKYFSILENQSVFSINGAHTDNIKKVQFMECDQNYFMSASSDKVVKLWDVRSYEQGPVSSMKLAQSIEDFALLDQQRFAVASGNTLSFLQLTDQQSFTKLNEYVAFQKPIMRVRYDKHRQRIIAGGMDNQLKFFSYEGSELKLSYKIKVPSEIFCMDVSNDGNHYSLGMNTGEIIIKSKLLEKEEDEQDEEQKLFKNVLKETYTSTSKNYRYFYRGQYVTPDIDDLIASQKARKQKLQAYEQMLKSFKYRQALIECLNQQNPELFTALIEELVERGVLETALANHSEQEIISILKFIGWKIQDYRYQSLLTELLRIIIDMYQGVIGGVSQNVDKLIKSIQVQLDSELKIHSELKQISGQIDMMMRVLQVQ